MYSDRGRFPDVIGFGCEANPFGRRTGYGYLPLSTLAVGSIRLGLYPEALHFGRQRAGDNDEAHVMARRGSADRSAALRLPYHVAVLFRAHARAVYNHCFRLVGDWSVAEDCTSLVYLEAWRLRGRVEPDGGNLLPWLLGIATHVMHRRHRVARRHRLLLERIPAADAVPDFADELVGRLEDAERVAVVRDVLRRLPRADRDVLALCVWAGLSYDAAAEALGVPIGTVRSRLSRARQRLDKLVEKNREPSSPGRQLTGGRTPAARPQGGNS